MRAIVVTILALFAVSFVAPPASAGGPTSVLLASPSTHQAAALYNGEPAYEALTRMVERGSVVPDAEVEAADGRRINVTWLVHDIAVWRVDQIDLDAPGGPQVRTQLMDPGSRTSESAPDTVRRVANPDELLALLTELGLLKSGAPGFASGDAAVADRPVSDDADVNRAAATQAADRNGKAWEWGIGGLVAGALLALSVGWLRRRWAAR